MLNAMDRGLIARGHDPFTNGVNVGMGRWGLGLPSRRARALTPSSVACESMVGRTGSLLACCSPLMSCLVSHSSPMHLHRSLVHRVRAGGSWAAAMGTISVWHVDLWCVCGSPWCLSARHGASLGRGFVLGLGLDQRQFMEAISWAGQTLRSPFCTLSTYFSLFVHRFGPALVEESDQGRTGRF